ncbi:MAG TPA: LamG domain-containing protein, partial [Dehalococcoidia bacterium]|nr:LamG domain-containing protein [Dehalococcoidia bacterium]
NSAELQQTEQKKDTHADIQKKYSAQSPPENSVVDGHIGQAIHLTGDHPVTTPVGNFSRSDPFSISCWIKIPSSFNRAVIFHRSKAWTDAGSRGYELIIDQDHLRWSLIHFWPGDAASIRMIEKVPTNRWVHVVVCSNGTGMANGLSISLDGHQVQTEVVQDNLTRTILGGGGDTITIGERMRDHGFKNGLVDEFRVFERVLSPLEIQECCEPGTLANTVKSKTDLDAISDYLADIDTDVLTHRKQLKNLYKDHSKLIDKSTEIMVMRESLQPK